MRAYDALPPELRQALANLIEDWSAHWVAKGLLRKGHSAEWVLAMLERWDREEASDA
jgi:hypothetical protein